MKLKDLASFCLFFLSSPYMKFASDTSIGTGLQDEEHD
jgi:hypothetical protein